jgi:tetratricopeptide (TPR) repeat protein
MKNVKSMLTGSFKKSLLATALFAAPALTGFVAYDVAPGQSLFIAGSAQAQSVKPMQPAAQKLKPRRLPGLSQSFIKDLQEVSDALDPSEEAVAEGAKSDPRKALELVNKMARNMEDYNPYEKVMVYTYYGSIYYNLENTDKTIENFENVVAQSPNLPVGTEAQYLYTLAQLYSQEDQPAKALNYLKRWSKMVTNISASQYAVIAQVYYANDNLDAALANMLEAINKYEASGKIAKEEWLGFIRAVYYSREDYIATLGVVEQLVRHYPKMSYWRQLVGLYYELGRTDDYYRALDSMYVMGGLDKEGQLRTLAGGFIDQDAPYKAAKILDKGINEDKIIKPTAKNLELLSNSWRLAQETDKALAEMKRAAAKSDDGDLYFNLARLLFSRDQFDAAVKAGKNALKKGNLSRPDSVHLTIGQAELSRNNFDAAIAAFKKAAKDDRSRKFATQWTSYAKAEKKRQDALKDN